MAKKTKIISLEVSTLGVYAVCICKDKKKAVVESVSYLDCSDKEVFDASDVVKQFLPQWLEENHWQHSNLVITLPDYATSTHLINLPVAKDALIDSMVAIETRQIVGLSEDEFTSGYSRMRPTDVLSNPVLIGLCMQNFVESYVADYHQQGLRVIDIGISSVSLANAFLHLRPEAKKEVGFQLLIDFGAESSSLVIMFREHMIFSASLSFSVSGLVDFLVHNLNLPESEAYNMLSGELGEEVQNDPAMHEFYEDLTNQVARCIAEWRDQEIPEYASLICSSITICGEPRIGLVSCQKVLSENFSVDCRILQVPEVEDKRLASAVVVPYGMALQSVGKVNISISMKTPKLQWLASRYHNLPQLRLAVAIFVTTLVVGILVSQTYLEHRKAYLTERNKELQECLAISRQIEDAKNSQKRIELQVLPLIIYGERATRTLQLLEALEKNRNPEDNFFYVSDAGMLQRRLSQGSSAQRNGTDTFRTTTRDMGRGSSNVRNTSEFPNRVTVQELKPLEKFYVAGIYPRVIGRGVGVPVITGLERYKGAGNQFPLLGYRGVDVMDPTMIPQEVRDLSREWEDFVLKISGRRSISSFKLEVPLENLTVKPFEELDESKTIN